MKRYLPITVFAGLLVLLPLSASAAEERAIFAGGCFWGVEAVFEHVKGVIDVRSGYVGGSREDADYRAVSLGRTAHAESVEIRFDPAKVTYEQLLYVFFAVAHDPTQIDRQGPDVGRQYRSVIFYIGYKQKASAQAFVKAVESSRVFDKPVATRIVPFAEFFVAEEEHQDFVRNNPADPYVVVHDLPKLQILKEKFPSLYRK